MRNMTIPVQPGRGDCSTKLALSGYNGVTPQVANPDHSDHRDAEERGVPPIGRGLEVRLGVANRQAAVDTQVGGFRQAVQSLKLRKSAIPSGWKAGTPTEGDQTIVDIRPLLGWDRPVAPTLGELQDEVRTLLLEGNEGEAKRLVRLGGQANPDWTPALMGCLEHWQFRMKLLQEDM